MDIAVVQSVRERIAERADYFTVKELARDLGVSDDTILRLRNKNDLPCVMIGGSIRFDGKKVAEWLRHHGG